jgi:protein disulfide-isomerase A1
MNQRRNILFTVSSISKEELESFLAELAIPIIDEVSGENYAMYASSPKPLAYVFIDPSLEDKDVHIATVQACCGQVQAEDEFRLD